MKTRTSLVSNSSTSSFICAVCNGSESSDDGGSLSDVEMFECDNCNCTIHTHCGDESKCPVCSLEKIPIEDEIIYLRKLILRSKDEVANDIKRIYGSRDNFVKWLNEQKELLKK